jgi:hypothetical protein
MEFLDRLQNSQQYFMCFACVLFVTQYKFVMAQVDTLFILIYFRAHMTFYDTKSVSEIKQF